MTRTATLTLAAALVLPALLASAQETPKQRDPFQTPPAVKRRAAQGPQADPARPSAARPSLHGLLLLKGKRPGALLRIGGESFVVRQGDEVSAAGRSWKVTAVDRAGVSLTRGTEQSPLRLTLR